MILFTWCVFEYERSELSQEKPRLCICVNTGEDDDRDLEKLEEKVWDPNSSLTEKQIDQFLVVAR